MDETTTTHHRVELANLLIPSPTTILDDNDEEHGGNTDGGSQVVLLEARFETCSDLLESSQAQIQAVIDLDKLSELVGISRDEFMNEMHNQVNEQLQLHSKGENAAAAATADDSELFLDAEQDDVALFDTAYGAGGVASSSSMLETIATEQTALLVSSPSQQQPPGIAVAPTAPPLPPTPVADRIALVADAFLDTLTDCLPETATVDDDLSRNAYFDTLDALPDRTAHLQTHAFLLEMPCNAKDGKSTGSTLGAAATTSGGNGAVMEPPHFILALPAADGPWDDNVSEASDTSFLHGVSFLPSDVQDVQIEAIPVPMPMDYAYNDDILDKPHYYQKVAASNEDLKHRSYPNGIRLDVVVKRQVPLIGYVILVTGLWALSSVGVALNWQGHTVSPLLKTYWRLASTALVLLPLAYHSMKSSGAGLPHEQLTTRSQWLLMITCSACYAFMCAAFVVALDLTTVVNAFVLSDLAPLFLIVGRWTIGLPVLYTEGLGAAIGFVGGAICATDTSSSTSMELNVVGGEISTHPTNLVLALNNSTTTASVGSGAVLNMNTHPHALTGDLLAFLASAATAIYLLIAKKLRPHIDLFMFMFLLMSLASVFLLMYMVLSGEDIRLSNDPNYGLWGWINWTTDRLPLEIYLAIVCNILGTTGYVAVMKYFEPVVVSTVMLMEPVLGALMGVAAGLDPLPGLQTWIGDGVVTIGIVLVVWSGARTTETIDATQALLQVDNSNENDAVATTTAKGATSNGGGVGGCSGGVPLLKSPVVTKGVPHRQ